MTTFKDYFSGKSQAYSRFRPGYPDELFAFLSEQTAGKKYALDCATGNGQAAKGLKKYYSHVIACDASREQIASAQKDQAVSFCVSRSEVLPFHNCSIDIVTVAQAAHWFDLPLFYSEVERIIRPGGCLAIWGYTLPHITPEIDQIISRFYYDIVGPYWPPERKWIEDEYRSLYFPFQKIPVPEFSFVSHLTAREFIGFLDTWSAVSIYRKEKQSDPIQIISDELISLWGRQRRSVKYPIHVLLTKFNVIS